MFNKSKTMKDEQLSLSDKTIILTLGSVLKKVNKFLLVIILVRLLTISDFGTYQQVWLIYLTLYPIFLFGIPTAVFYFIPRLSDEKKKIFTVQTIITLFFIGLIMSSFMYFFSDFIALYFNNPKLILLLKIFSLYPIFAIPISYLFPFLVSIKKERLGVKISIFFELMITIAVLIPIFLGLDLSIVFWSVVVIGLIQYLLFLLVISKHVHIEKIFFDFKLFVLQMKYSIPLGFSFLVGHLGDYIDKIVISIFYSSQYYALYSVGSMSIPIIAVVITSLYSILLPKFSELQSKNNLNKILEILHAAIRKTTLIFAPLFFFLFIVSESFIVFLYTQTYLESVIIFRIYLFVMLIYLIPVSTVILGMGKSKLVLKISFIFLLMNTVLNILFIKIFGFPGPALATVVSMFIIIIYYFINIGHLLKVSLLNILPYRLILKNFLVALCPSIIIFPITLSNLHPLIILILSAIFFFPIYTILIIKFNLLRESDKKLIKKWIKLKIL